MLPTIKKILYATDLSDNARFAFGYAAGLAERYEAGITMVHVIEHLSPSAMHMVGSFVGHEEWNRIQQRRENEFRDIIKQRLTAFCDEMQAEHDQCMFVVDRIEVLHGEPVDQILALATERPFDLLVMGTRGYGRIANALMGSTARRIVRRSTVPVLTVRLPRDRP